MVRTQIYLSNEQREALKALAYAKDQNVSDLIRRAIDRLLKDEFEGKVWATEMAAVVEKMRATGPELSDDEIDAAIEADRKQQATVHA